MANEANELGQATRDTLSANWPVRETGRSLRKIALRRRNEGR